ncbi:hypothetical protein Bca52824_025420 [Brassica carinata]|uniref:Uncharacterized protein n=1 Tax=Brassica carinata TaxID=52824 RepID=A0A8X7V868_BRACI|nr:hypothetical protein Bca52824_025420 [Brassica carinata]
MRMGLDYSYTQPSQSDDYGLGNTTESDHCSTEMNIMLDQAEIEASHVQYPPQPEVEFGFPKECYCGGEPVLRTSITGRRNASNMYELRSMFVMYTICDAWCVRSMVGM